MAQGKSKNYYCIVPMCSSTSKNSPNKEFIMLPRDINRRKVWLYTIRRQPGDISEKTTAYVCEDHFNLEEDLENYMEYKMMGANKRLKSNVFPHRFDCQINRSLKHKMPERSVVTKRKRLDLIHGLEKPTSAAVLKGENMGTTSEDFNPHLVMELPQLSSKFENKSVQVRPSFRSNGTQCDLYNIKKVDVTCSPIKINLCPVQLNRDSYSEKSPNKSSVSSITSNTLESDYSESFARTSSSSESFKTEISDEKMKKNRIERSLYFIEKRPKLYLGLPNDCYFTLEILQKYIKLPLINILIVLKKIKSSFTYIELGDDFGISNSSVSRIFLLTIPKVASYLKKLIMWPPQLKIVRNLPISFRVRNANVQSIIDCFEIEIEKPSDPFKQAMTWSDYKKCNTVKYLVSATPDGFINFISNGFGGRASDTTIAEHSGYLESLAPGCAVMADRGFKHIEPNLIEKRCQLIRLPSVPSGTKSSKSDVILTKQIASLRIYIERVVRRIREFNMLKRHSVIDHRLLSNIDQIVIVVCGLINLQGPLIK